MAAAVRAALVAGVVGVVFVAPAVYYRDAYAHGKRLREVTPGRFYRCGQLTEAGFEEALSRLGIRCVLNVQDDYPDPDLSLNFWTRRTVKESELCRRLNVHYVNLAPDLVSRRAGPGEHPAVIDEFLRVMDDPDNYPALIHCKAGLHRTGILVAVYRMEYEGWSPADAFREAREHGFGNWTSANEYVTQYILDYRPPHPLGHGGLSMIPTLMDRQMIRGYFKAYFVCLTSLLSLYVVVDLFMNLDEFSKHGKGFSTTLHHIASYYGYRIAKIFDQLCEAIVLLAAMFTVALMQRNNEQMPFLSAGVSTHRLVTPVLLCASAMLSLTVMNQELVVPRVAEQLGHAKDDPSGAKALPVRGQFDRTGVQVDADEAYRKGLTVRRFRCLIPEAKAGNQIHLTADEAHYHKGAASPGGYWELIGTQCWPADQGSVAGLLDVVDTGRYRLYTKEVDFDALTRAPNWFLLASTVRLYEELQKPDSTRLTSMAVLFHMRLTRPVLGLLLVFLGLSVILRDQNRNVILSSGMCLVLCGLFFGVNYACKMLGDNDYLGPALAAWLPVLLFGPLAVALFDAVHT